MMHRSRSSYAHRHSGDKQSILTAIARCRTLVTGLLVAVLLLARTETVRVQGAAGLLDSVTPDAARVGELVTVTGRGLGAIAAHVSVGGVPAAIVQANGTRVVFRVPANIPTGVTTVAVANPGGHGGSLSFRVLEGFLLSGDSSARVADVTYDLTPGPFDASQLRNGLFYNRLDIRVTPTATVSELNAALQQVQGGVVSMARGFTSLTIAIPPAAAIADLERVATTLDTLSGIRLAKLAHEPQPRILFTDVNADNVTAIRHLLPSRFPAAWNLVGMMLGSDLLCATPPVPVLVADYFGPEPPAVFPTQVPVFRRAAAPARPLNEDEQLHGYLVAMTLDGTTIGANPVNPCLDLRLVQTAGFSPTQNVDSIVGRMPASGRFIVNYSMGFGGNECAASPCVPPHDILRTPRARADDALYWKEHTHTRWNRFLMVVAAGNEADKEGTTIYPGMGDARFSSEMSISQEEDPFFRFMGESSLWDPRPAFAAQGFESLRPTALVQAQTEQSVRDKGLDGPDATAANVIVVGSVTNQSVQNELTQHVTPDQLAESVFSNRNPDLYAPGESLFGSDLARGTSLAAPQVAGLASYLWALSPSLRDEQSITATKSALMDNARNRVIDAYASVLSLDPPAPLTPQRTAIRRILLDADNDTKFTEVDLVAFLRHLYVVDQSGDITHQPAPGTNVDFSRFDLNGDGFTTAGARRERFDLDRVDSTQYGAASYRVISEDIEGQEIRFDETALTDVEILCYYAYSPLYQGDPDARKHLLAGRCGLAIQPSTVTLAPNTHQQFTPSDLTAPLSWTADGGTITQTGLYTAPSAAGTYTVRATRTDDANVSAKATVTVTAPPSSRTFSGTLTMTRVNRDFLVESLSATVTLQVTASGQITILSASGTDTSFCNVPDCEPLSVPISPASYSLNNVDNGTDDTLQFTFAPSPGGVNVKGHRVFVNGQLVEIDFTRREDFLNPNVNGVEHKVITTPYVTITIPEGAQGGTLVGQITQTGILRPIP